MYSVGHFLKIKTQRRKGLREKKANPEVGDRNNLGKGGWEEGGKSVEK